MSIINYLTRIRFGFGVLATLGEELEALGVQRPLLVTDGGLVRLGMAERAIAHMPGNATVTLYDETPENPTESAVLAALECYRSGGCDGLVALGGGSSIDLAKGVSLLAGHAPPLPRYAAILGGSERITAAVAPMVAVPTTAGTGSEVGRGALITLDDGRKLGFLSPHLIPKTALCDPELTFGLPPALTAATGMDAITHCIETYLSPRDNPVAEAIALDGLARGWSNIMPVVTRGDDRNARREMMLSALMGGLTFQKGLGAVHAISHPLGGLQSPRLHHGTLNAVLLPHVLRFNRDHVGAKYETLKRAMGLPKEVDLAEAVESRNAEIGLPANLRDMGVREEVRPFVVEGALADHSTATNPRPVSHADYEALFTAALG